jgi:hypothetical protein
MSASVQYDPKLRLRSGGRHAFSTGLEKQTVPDNVESDK